jgi:hypothetical protein
MRPILELLAFIVAMVLIGLLASLSAEYIYAPRL